jgi:hypothetical protein
VPVAQIGGGVGRCSEFERDFMPAKASVQERWKQIDRAFWRDEELSAVSLYIGRRFGRPMVAHLVREKTLDRRAGTIGCAEG